MGTLWEIYLKKRDVSRTLCRNLQNDSKTQGREILCEKTYTKLQGMLDLMRGCGEITPEQYSEELMDIDTELTGFKTMYFGQAPSNVDAEGKIILELTKAEILMLQELTEHLDGGYEWMLNIAENLRTKVKEAYKKPAISQEEFQKRLESERDMWRGEPVEELMVRAESSMIRFFYEVEESGNG